MFLPELEDFKWGREAYKIFIAYLILCLVTVICIIHIYIFLYFHVLNGLVFFLFMSIFVYFLLIFINCVENVLREQKRAKAQLGFTNNI